MPSTSLLIAVPVALIAAISFGLSSSLQYRAAHQVPARRPGDPGMFLDLLRTRTWPFSIVLNILGFALQVLALRFGPVMVVQPLLVMGLLVYVLVTPLVDHRRPELIRVVGALLTVAGLTAFLSVAQPTDAGGRDLNPLNILPLLIGLGGGLVICLAASYSVAARWRALPLAMATGICYGVTAGLVRSLSNRFGDGFPELFLHWQLYAICLVGPLGVLLNQNTFQAGRFGSPALAIITTVDPLISIGVGLLWLEGRITVGVGAVIGEIISLAVMVAGIAVLSSRAPHVASPPDRPHRSRRHGGGAGNLDPDDVDLDDVDLDEVDLDGVDPGDVGAERLHPAGGGPWPPAPGESPRHRPTGPRS